MTPAKKQQPTELSRDLLQAFDNLNGGVHPGFRPAHAKGILLTGTFTPAPAAAALSRAPHLRRSSTPVSVRFSDFAGVPNVADNGPHGAPRGMATRFHLAEHVHTDIVAHSTDGFPTRTAEEFLEFLRAAASGTIGAFLASHPAALEFVQSPKPFPTSFATDGYFGVTAYRFIDSDGTPRFGRYRIRPVDGASYIDDPASQSPDYLFDEMRQRVAAGSVKMRISVQIAAPGDIVDDATHHWPVDRPELDFGTLELTAIAPNDHAEQRHIIFDPIPRVEGIESSGDPLLDPRADAYLASGRRRRAGGAA